MVLFRQNLGINNKFGDCKPILGTLIQKRCEVGSLRGEGIYSKKYGIVIQLFQLSNYRYSINQVLGAVWFLPSVCTSIFVQILKGNLELLT